MDVNATPKARPELDMRSVGNETVVHDPVGGKVHVLNGTAAEVLRACDGATPLRTIAGRIAATFDTDPGRVEEDAVAIATRFRELGLIV